MGVLGVINKNIVILPQETESNSKIARLSHQHNSYNVVQMTGHENGSIRGSVRFLNRQRRVLSNQQFYHAVLVIVGLLSSQHAAHHCKTQHKEEASRRSLEEDRASFAYLRSFLHTKFHLNEGNRE